MTRLAKKKQRRSGSSTSPSAAPPATSSSTDPASAKTLPFRAIYGDPRLVPAVPLIVHGPGGKIAVPGLIDSGADNSMFPVAWVQRLGIDLAKCAEEDCNTAGGMTKQHVWTPGMEAEIQGVGVRVRLAACFSDVPIVLLGRNDFFNAFRVTIDYRAETFTLEKYAAPV